MVLSIFYHMITTMVLLQNYILLLKVDFVHLFAEDEKVLSHLQKFEKTKNGCLRKKIAAIRFTKGSS